MTLSAVFLSTDRYTLVTERIAHIHTSEIEEEDCSYYEHTFFLLHDHHLALVTSDWAHEHFGCFLGIIEDGTDPEVLREQANEIVCGVEMRAN